MARTMRQGTKTITMAPVPEDPALAPVTQQISPPGGSANESLVCEPGKLRKKRDWRSRKSIRSFRSRCMTA